MLTITVQGLPYENRFDKLPGKNKYAHIVDQKDSGETAAFKNYKRAKEEFLAMLETDRKWREAIQQELDRALSDYFNKR